MQKENVSANLTMTQKQSSIPKIERLIQKLKQFNASTISNRSDAQITVMEGEIENLLVNIFEPNTIEYRRYHYHILPLDTAPVNLYREVPIIEIQQALVQNITKAIKVLESIRQGFQDDAQDLESDKPSRTLKAFNGLELHTRIANSVNDLYKNGHYSNAVQEGVKALVLYVKEKSGKINQDGKSLMEHVFSLNNPILKFNSLLTQSDKDEQLGFMYLFTGAVLGIRNPRAHENITDDPETALEFIAFISLLAKLVDRAVNT